MKRFLFASVLATCSSLFFSCTDSQSNSTAPSLESPILAVSVTMHTPAKAARAQTADPGGKLLAELHNPSRGILLRDSANWNGEPTARLAFANVTEGQGWSAVVRYRDGAGRITHKDSSASFTIQRGDTSHVTLTLKPALGKILLQAPVTPTGVDTLGLVYVANGQTWANSAVRGSGGRSIVRLDSLPIGVAGTLRLRAWNTNGDTLYHLDTTLTLTNDQDLLLAFTMRNSNGSSSLLVGFQAGGEANVSLSFSGELDQPATQLGGVVISAISDSGNSDWIRLTNVGTSSFVGKVKLGKGSGDMTLDLNLPAQASTIVTRAPCDIAQTSPHPLATATHLTCGQDLAVVTHSTSGGTLWKLRNESGALLDQVFVQDAKLSWPDLNTTTARTVVVRAASKTAMGNDAGRSWCTVDSDSPTVSCE